MAARGVGTGNAPALPAAVDGRPPKRRASRRRYAAARAAAVLGTGVAAAGFWVGVVSAPLPAAAGQSRDVIGTGRASLATGAAGMRHGPGPGGMSGMSGMSGAGRAGMDHGAVGAGGTMRHGPPGAAGGMAGPRLRTRGS